jgi:hypothetical protein
VKFENECIKLSTGLTQRSVVLHLFYLLCTADLQTSTESTIAISTNDTGKLAMNSDPAFASQKLEASLDIFKKCLKMENES